MNSMLQLVGLSHILFDNLEKTSTHRILNLLKNSKDEQLNIFSKRYD